MHTIDRRDFLKRGALTTAGGLALGGPLQAFAMRAARGETRRAEGYGPLIEQGELALPDGFSYRVVSREGDPMSDGNPTPGIFDGMAAYAGGGGTTILIRNHENRRRAGETPVIVSPELRYDGDTSYNAGCTKLVLAPDGSVAESFAVIGGMSTNCAGGATPWGSWITCEEIYDQGAQPHGYAFEVPADARSAVAAEPIRAAGRFVREAVAWFDGVLYQTEDRGVSVLTRYTPDGAITQAGQLAPGTGRLQGLRVPSHPGINTSLEWQSTFGLGKAVPVDWVDIAEPEPAPGAPSTDGFVRNQALAQGAATFSRQEGVWVGGGRVYFDCTDGGAASLGQIWEFNPRKQELKLVFESSSDTELKNPDNLVVVPATRDVFLCEDADPPMFVRGITRGGSIYDFARAVAYPDSEFCGACFDPSSQILFVNQQGNRSSGGDKILGITYAISGPWDERED